MDWPSTTTTKRATSTAGPGAGPSMTIAAGHRRWPLNLAGTRRGGPVLLGMIFLLGGASEDIVAPVTRRAPVEKVGWLEGPEGESYPANSSHAGAGPEGPNRAGGLGPQRLAHARRVTLWPAWTDGNVLRMMEICRVAPMGACWQWGGSERWKRRTNASRWRRRREGRSWLSERTPGGRPTPRGPPPPTSGPHFFWKQADGSAPSVDPDASSSSQADLGDPRPFNAGGTYLLTPALALGPPGQPETPHAEMAGQRTPILRH
ncbi:MAG: hypothetical protein CM15mP18_4410 [Methanobacteriota archaeon]|nr:MAG: hypothetical protein CM15mP18_4410 [Euryarchaeota archaeon]